MSNAGNKPTVVVWGHFHGGNLGDDLVVTTVVDAIRERCPEARIIGVSLAPADCSARHGIETFPINPGAALVHRRGAASTTLPRSQGWRRVARRVPFLRTARHLLSATAGSAREPRFALQVYRLLRETDLVVVAGGGMLADWWGPWKHPYTTYRWALLARLTRTPMAFLSVGAGPIDSRLSALFFGRAIATASYLTARDHDSARIISESLGVSAPVPIVADMAFGLPEPLWPDLSRSRPSAGQPLMVGINVMAYEDPRYFRDSASDRYQRYIERMAGFARSLLEEGHSVVLFSSQTVADELVALDVMHLLAAEGYPEARLRSTVEEIRDLEDLVEVLAACDLIVATRFHSTLLPILFGIPVIGIAYHAKTLQLFRDVGHSERVIEIGEATEARLLETFHQVLAADDSDPSAQAHRESVTANRAAVARQFDAVLADLCVTATVRPVASEHLSDSGIAANGIEMQVPTEQHSVGARRPES